MEFFELVKKRHSVRKYTTDTVPEEDIKKILDAARLAPSANNGQMWHFVVIFNESIKKQLKESIINKYDELKTIAESPEEQKQLEASKFYSTFFADAPAVIAVFMKPTTNLVHKMLLRVDADPEIIARTRPRPDIQSMGAAMQNISLAAEDLGYGTCWCTAPIVAYKKMEEIIKFDSEYELIALMSLGKPQIKEGVTVKANKKPLTDVMTILD